VHRKLVIPMLLAGVAAIAAAPVNPGLAFAVACDTLEGRGRPFRSKHAGGWHPRKPRNPRRR
jgi:hypothetical protein